jgi:hypothetical protein
MGGHVPDRPSFDHPSYGAVDHLERHANIDVDGKCAGWASRMANQIDIEDWEDPPPPLFSGRRFISRLERRGRSKS